MQKEKPNKIEATSFGVKDKKKKKKKKEKKRKEKKRKWCGICYSQNEIKQLIFFLPLCVIIMELGKKCGPSNRAFLGYIRTSKLA